MADLVVFAADLLEPRTVSAQMHQEATSVQFPGLTGVLPGFGVQRPNDWGLGFEIRDDSTVYHVDVRGEGDKQKEQKVGDFRAAMDWLIAQAEHATSRQRYKGLGEMNPEQLWETTINPASRRLLQVRIEDAIAADVRIVVEDASGTVVGEAVHSVGDLGPPGAASVAPDRNGAERFVRPGHGVGCHALEARPLLRHTHRSRTGGCGRPAGRRTRGWFAARTVGWGSRGPGR